MQAKYEMEYLPGRLIVFVPHIYHSFSEFNGDDMLTTKLRGIG